MSKSSDAWPPNLGRIGDLANNLRAAAWAVLDDMRRTPGGDAFEYHGSTNSVEMLIAAVNELEHFYNGWRK